MRAIIIAGVAGVALFGAELNSNMQSYLVTLKEQAKKENSEFMEFDAKRGEQLFFAKSSASGKEMSCTSCHKQDITQDGFSEKKNKKIKPLAPSVNQNRLTDVDEVQKWLKRNFNDVYAREGSAQEKGDVIMFINSK